MTRTEAHLVADVRFGHLTVTCSCGETIRATKPARVVDGRYARVLGWTGSADDALAQAFRSHRESFGMRVK